MSKRQNTWKNTPAVGQKCARVGMRTSQINFVQPFKGFKFDDEEEWVDTLGLTKLLKVMRASYGLAEYGSRYTEFIQEFRILNEGPPLRYVSTVTILEGESPRKYEIDADFLSRLFKIPHNPDGMQLGGSREGRWPEGGKYFENDTKTYDKKKGWRLENLKPEYKQWKKRYELLRRLIWLGKRSDFVGNGQARAIRDVLTCADLERPDWATSLLRSFAHEIISIQKTAARLPNRYSVTYIGPIICHILYPELFNTLQETSSQAADSADDPNKMELDLVSEQPDPGDNDSGVSLKAWNYGGSRTTGNGPETTAESRLNLHQRSSRREVLIAAVQVLIESLPAVQNDPQRSKAKKTVKILYGMIGNWLFRSDSADEEALQKMLESTLESLEQHLSNLERLNELGSTNLKAVAKLYFVISSQADEALKLQVSLTDGPWRFICYIATQGSLKATFYVVHTLLHLRRDIPGLPALLTSRIEKMDLRTKEIVFNILGEVADLGTKYCEEVAKSPGFWDSLHSFLCQQDFSLSEKIPFLSLSGSVIPMIRRWFALLQTLCFAESGVRVRVAEIPGFNDMIGRALVAFDTEKKMRLLIASRAYSVRHVTDDKTLAPQSRLDSTLYRLYICIRYYRESYKRRNVPQVQLIMSANDILAFIQSDYGCVYHDSY